MGGEFPVLLLELLQISQLLPHLGSYPLLHQDLSLQSLQFIPHLREKSHLNDSWGSISAPNVPCPYFSPCANSSPYYPTSPLGDYNPLVGLYGSVSDLLTYLHQTVANHSLIVYMLCFHPTVGGDYPFSLFSNSPLDGDYTICRNLCVLNLPLHQDVSRDPNSLSPPDTSLYLEGTLTGEVSAHPVNIA